MIRAIILLPVLCGAVLPAVARTMDAYDTAVLRLLDKGTARVEQIELPVGKPHHFGRMQVTVYSCRQAPPEETPESTALMAISEMKPGQPVVDLFRGWMFASNPALSALEHPLYDVWVIACKNASAGSPDALPPDESAAPPPEEKPEKSH